MIKLSRSKIELPWIENQILEAKKILDGDIPECSDSCSYCKYIRDTKVLL